MKRIFSLILVLALVLVFLVTPVFAADEDPFYYDLLDYSSNLDSGSNHISFTNSYECTYDLPKEDYIFYVDILFTCSESSSTSFTQIQPKTDTSSYSSYLTIISLGDGMYRAYGQMPYGTASQLWIKFSGVGSFDLTILRINVASKSYDVFQAAVRGYGTVVNADDLNIGYNISGVSNSFMYTFRGDFNDASFRSYYKCDNWRAYDYLDVQLYYVVSSITSISCTIGDLSVPVKTSFLESNSVGGPGYFVTLSVDLTSVPHDLTDNLEIQVIGVSNYDTTGMIAIVGASGLVYVERDSVSLWFYKLNYNLDLWFASLLQALDPNPDAAAGAAESANQAAASLGEVIGSLNLLPRPDVTGMGSISSIVPTASLLNFTPFLSSVITAPYIGEVVTLSLILSLAAYVFFGKR